MLLNGRLFDLVHIGWKIAFSVITPRNHTSRQGNPRATHTYFFGICLVLFGVHLAMLYGGLLFSLPVQLHGGLICLAFCLSIYLWLDKNYWTTIHISGTVWVRVTRFSIVVNIHGIWVTCEGQGHGSNFQVTMSKNVMWFLWILHFTFDKWPVRQRSQGSRTKVTLAKSNHAKNEIILLFLVWHAEIIPKKEKENYNHMYFMHIPLKLYWYKMIKFLLQTGSFHKAKNFL